MKFKQEIKLYFTPVQEYRTILNNDGGITEFSDSSGGVI